jgi:penicillin-binding protein 2
LALLGRLCSLQLVEESYERCQRLSQHQSRVFSPPRRGRIFSRDGKVLAANRPVFDLQLDYRKLNPRAEPLEILLEELKKRFPFPDQREVEDLLVGLANREELAIAPAGGPEGAGGGQGLRLVEKLDAATAALLRRRLRRYEGFFELRQAKDDASWEVLFYPRKVLTMEITLQRLAELLDGPRVKESTRLDLRKRVDAMVEEVENRVAKELEETGDGEEPGEARKAVLRRLHYQQRWLLLENAPLSVVAQIEYHPERFPGIQVVDGMEREYPLKERCGTLIGYLRRLGAEEEASLRRSGHLLDSLPPLLEAEDGFAQARQGSFRRTDLLPAGGLEEAYDRKLRGLYGMSVWSVDNWNRPREKLEEIPPQDGEDIHTTIESELQDLLYDALERSVRKPNGGPGVGSAGSAAVMEVESGALLASVGFPGVDSNLMTERPGSYTKELKDSWGEQTGGWFLDRPSRHALYPGSIFKIVLAAAALEAAEEWEGKYSLERRYPCHHEFELVKGVHCASRNGHGQVNLIEALQYSCNNYFYFVGLKHLGPEKIYQWASRFGYGLPTGVDLVPSVYEKGSLHAPELVKSPLDVCHYSIGQVHVTATPLQVLRSIAAVAAGGKGLPHPYLVTPAPALDPSPFRSPRTAAVIKQGLWDAAHRPEGTASDPSLGLSRFNAALKTGTAEREVRSELVHEAWLVGFAPFDSPRIAFVAAIEDTDLHGAQACAPLVSRLLEYFAAKDPEAFLLDAKSRSKAKRPEAGGGTE